MIDTLGDALPREITRVRDDVLPVFVALGKSGVFTSVIIRQHLNRASKAMIEGDVLGMISCYESLKECSL